MKRPAQGVTLQRHQTLRLPQKVSGLILITHQTSFTLRPATDLLLQRHQVLPLPRKMTSQKIKSRAENG